MSSFQQTFAKDSSIDKSTNGDDWTPVKQHIKKAPSSQKPSQDSSKQSWKTGGGWKYAKAKPIAVQNSDSTSSEEILTSQPVQPVQQDQKEAQELASGSDNQTNSNSVRKPRGPPRGIEVRLDKEWKDWVRGLVPNKGANKPDRLVMDEIGKLKANQDITFFKFKQIVCMIFHQALKTNRNTLIQQIIKRWKDSRYEIIELIDSTYDRCKPIFQACWSGSLDCIQLIVASDPTGQVLKSVHPSKPEETIMDTLTMGMNRALTDNPSNVQIFHRRYTECINYIQAATRRMESLEQNSDSSNEISPELRDEIEKIKTSGSNVVEDFVAKIAEYYIDNQEVATNFFKAVKELTDPTMFDQIDSRLKDEGIEL